MIVTLGGKAGAEVVTEVVDSADEAAPGKIVSPVEQDLAVRPLRQDAAHLVGG